MIVWKKMSTTAHSHNAHICYIETSPLVPPRTHYVMYAYLIIDYAPHGGRRTRMRSTGCRRRRRACPQFSLLRACRVPSSDLLRSGLRKVKSCNQLYVHSKSQPISILPTANVDANISIICTLFPPHPTYHPPMHLYLARGIISRVHARNF